MKLHPPVLVRSLLSTSLCVVAVQPVLAGSVQGVVRGPAGKPLAGAMVTVIEAGDRSLTNTDGQYYLPDIPAGRSTIVATSAGYLPAVSAVTVKEDGITAQTFALKVDQSLPASLVKSLPGIRPAVTISSVITTAQWQPPLVTESGPVENGWQITAKTDKAFYAPGKPILVTASLKNVSEKDQYLFDADFAGDFEFTVAHDETEMPMTEYGTKSREDRVHLQRRNHSDGGAIPELIFGPIHPGQTKTYTLVVNRFQDMTLGGTYTIIVKREPNSSKQLVADPVQVEVRSAGTQ